MKIIVILVSIVLFWSGVFYFVSCSDQPEKRAVKVAELALKASVDNAESVRVRGISQPDSVFGREYVSMDEKMSLSLLMMKINEKVMKETNGLENFDPEDKDMVELMERQMTTMSVLRSLMTRLRSPSTVGRSRLSSRLKRPVASLTVLNTGSSWTRMPVVW